MKSAENFTLQKWFKYNTNGISLTYCQAKF